MKKVGCIRVILSLILMISIMIKANLKHYVSEKMEFSTEEAVDNSIFTFLPEETPILIYEGITEYGTRSYRFALYKETIEKDIVFVNMVFVEKDTENVYIWGEEELVLIGMLDKAKMILSESPFDDSYNNSNLKNMETDELLDRVMEVLMQNQYSRSNLIYDGIIEFLNRDYYMISSFDDFEDHILRKQIYYIDSRDGYVYRAEENADFLRTELYYIGNL